MGAAERIREEYRRKAAGSIVHAAVEALSAAITRSGIKYAYDVTSITREQVRALVEEAGTLLVLLDEAYPDLAEAEPPAQPESGEVRIEGATQDEAQWGPVEGETHAALGAALKANLKSGGLL